MNFKKFIRLLSEATLHPELKSIIELKTTNKIKKQNLIIKKIKELAERGEPTGLEGEMPKGSSRAFLTHEEPEIITIDGKPFQQIKVGTKIAIRANLDKFHNESNFNNLKLGALQNKAEGGSDEINRVFRILIQDKNHPHSYITNEKLGIFPPLLDHDVKNHEWTQIGYCGNIKKSEFPTLTKESDFPKGITFDQFITVLNRNYLQNICRYYQEDDEKEKELDKLKTHPLLEKFLIYHDLYKQNAYDYQQIQNLGVFVHPVSGKKFIVARDHGFTNEVRNAYNEAYQILKNN